MSDHTLYRWEKLPPKFARAALLTGNGASRAIWTRFEYTSLYELARSDQISHPLEWQDEALFDAFETTNFEHVLRSLRTAIQVNEVLRSRTEPHQERYEAIRTALLESVNAVHVPWDVVGRDRLDYISGVMAEYRAIFTTNYDLLVYWAIMRDPSRFGDFFWEGCFNPKNTGLREGRVPVYFLHGALHLFRNDDGATCKRTREEWKNLLDLFRTDAGFVDPLFVSEGTSHDKLRAIRESDYLTFAHDELWADKGPFVIFGHGLGDEDEHIRAALQRPSLDIAIAVRATAESELREKIARYEATLSSPRLLFFDAASHPLGEARLEVDC